MFRTIAVTMLSLTTPWSAVLASESRAPAPPAPITSESAVQRARVVLAEKLQLPESELAVTSVEPQTWSDSGMGCSGPGTMVLHVITNGYAVSLAARGRQHRVHVSGDIAVECPARLSRRELKRPGNARGLDVMIEKARLDLAQRLGVEQSAIRLLGAQPQQWIDSAMECPRPDESLPMGSSMGPSSGPVSGYRLSLQHEARVYSYHTDMKDVRACPAIEAQ